MFDGRTFHSPSQAYAHTIVTYSYGKTLLAPGMRIGYLTVPPTLPERAELRDRFLLAQVASGYSFPNADLQHAIEDLEELSVDVGALERRRDRMGSILDELGYEHTMPEGTFYILARSPIADDRRFAEILAEEGAVVLPGAVVEVPGWFRISLTASDAMVEASVGAFDRARERAATEAPEPAPAEICRRPPRLRLARQVRPRSQRAAVVPIAVPAQPAHGPAGERLLRPRPAASTCRRHRHRAARCRTHRSGRRTSCRRSGRRPWVAAVVGRAAAGV